MITFRKIINKCSEKYLSLLLNIPPKYQGIVDWVRILFWDYPKFIFLPQIINKENRRLLTNKSSRKLYISYIPTTEGIGGQLCRFSTARILADKFGLTYIHHPFGIDLHCPSLNWDRFFGFNKSSISCETFLKDKKVDTCYLPRFDLRYLKKLQLDLLEKTINIRKKTGKDTLFFVTGYSFYPNNEYKNWPKILKLMRQEYLDTSKPPYIKSFFVKDKINVAVLIRRGEITDLYKKKTFQGLWRWVDISWYEVVLSKLVCIYGSNIRIEIFSDTSFPSELTSLEHFPNTRIHLLKDSKYQPFIAFNTMSNADIVVCGLSGFSYFAASFSDGIKIVPPAKVRVNYFPEEEGEGWVFSDKNGNFDGKVVKRYLSNKIEKSL